MCGNIVSIEKFTVNDIKFIISMVEYKNRVLYKQWRKTTREHYVLKLHDHLFVV